MVAADFQMVDTETQVRRSGNHAQGRNHLKFETGILAIVRPSSPAPRWMMW
jgi:hypothetical protein